MTLCEEVVEWLKEQKAKGIKGVVLGLSGGKDSTTVAMLAKKVWGIEVIAVMMPNCMQPDIDDSIEIASELDLRYVTVNIGDTFMSLVNDIEFADNIKVTSKAKTNIAPRIRMTALYAIAQTLGYCVIGTGNYSERYLGWTTKWGDSACDLNPIGNLTKTEVVEIGLELAEEFGLDKKFITKAPSDGLTGKTDEDNFGFTYHDLDGFLLNKMPPDPEVERKILDMHFASLHKINPIPMFEKTTQNTLI